MSRRKPGPAPEAAAVLFDVFYEDGSRTSNRKVPGSAIAGFAGDDGAMTYMMDEERRIADLSGRPAKAIKRMARSGA